jgi:hypothetical protein
LDGDEVVNGFEVKCASVGDRLNDVEALGVRMSRGGPDQDERAMKALPSFRLGAA